MVTLRQHRRTLRGALLLGALAPLIVVAACKKKAPEVVEDPVWDGVGVEQPLQVVAISPDTVGAATAVPARILGAGFQQGASVRIGDRLVGPVSWLDENTLTLTVPALQDGVYDVTVQNPDTRESTLRAGLRVGAGYGVTAACNDLVLYFPLDEAGLSAQARQALDANRTCYAGITSGIRIEGHADERGTTDYNLALGHRRADSVRMYLVNGGVAPDRLETVSWGEERPADPGHGESAWAKNRRVELHVVR